MEKGEWRMKTDARLYKATVAAGVWAQNFASLSWQTRQTLSITETQNLVSLPCVAPALRQSAAVDAPVGVQNFEPLHRGATTTHTTTTASPYCPNQDFDKIIKINNNHGLTHTVICAAPRRDVACNVSTSRRADNATITRTATDNIIALSFACRTYISIEKRIPNDKSPLGDSPNRRETSTRFLWVDALFSIDMDSLTGISQTATDDAFVGAGRALPLQCDARTIPYTETDVAPRKGVARNAPTSQCADNAAPNKQIFNKHITK